MTSFGPAVTRVAVTPDDRRLGVRTRTLADLAAGRPEVDLRSPHRVDQHVLLLVTAGHGSHMVDFEHYACRPGTLLWARAGQVVHHGRGLDAILVSWQPGFLPPIPATPWAIDDPFGPVCWQLTGEDEDAVIDEVSQLAVDCARFGHGEVAVEMLRHQLAVLVLRILMVPSVEPPAASDADLDTFLRFRRAVEVSFATCRRVETYAADLGCSVRTLTRACLAATGRSAKQVLDERVALAAKRLLACTAQPIAAIGEQLGFPGPTHFGRFFHREVGCTPGAFRGTGDTRDPFVPRQRG